MTLYLWLKLKGLSHRWAMWIAHPLERAREWLYWRDLLLLPWEKHGWEWNTERNRLKRKLDEVEGKRFSGADV